MHELVTLLLIPVRRLLNGLKRPAEVRWTRWVFLLLVGALLMGAIFGLLRLMIGYFYQQPVIGVLLVNRIFSMFFLVFLFMLVYSNILASLSSHFLSRDLAHLHASPARPTAIFFAKAMEALVSSSWMVVFLCVPLYAALGVVKGVQWPFYALAMTATIPFLLIPAAFSMLVNIGLMHVFPAQRLREIMVLTGTLMFCAAMVVFRLMEPEKLVTPSDDMLVLEFMTTLAAPSAPYLPSAWAGQAVIAASNVAINPLAYWMNLGWLWAAAAVLWALCLVLASRWYTGAWQQANESLNIKRGVRLARSWLPLRVGPYLSILLKDFKVFIREPAQWGQIFLLAVLVLIYLSSLAKIPPSIAQGLRSLLFFLNLGLIGLILTAVAARFLFPLVSMEAGSFELLRIAPLSMERYLWTRLLAGLVPLLFLALALVGFSIPLLGVDWFMALVAFLSVIGMTLAVSALAVGCGAAFAKFRVSNPEEIVTSAGGFFYMALSAIYIIGILLLESQPVRLYYFSALFHRPFAHQVFTAVSLATVVAVTAACVIGSIRLGARALTAREL